VKFSEVQFHPNLQSTLDSIGFADCTPVQQHTIPAILQGKDVAGLAQTGTGKTAAFLLPLMERILRSQDAKKAGIATPPPIPVDASDPHVIADLDEAAVPTSPEALVARSFYEWAPMNFVLVLVPTRELCEQVYENAAKFGEAAGLRAVSIYGGVAYEKQKDALRGGVEFVIATPGRLLDLYKDNLVDLKQVRAIVFDEADRMFDMGFKDDMKYILTRVPKERQFMVFSATLNLDVMNTAYQFGANPVEFNVSRDQPKADNVDDKILHVGQDEKGAFLLGLLKTHTPRQAIIFSNYKMNVPRVSQFLNDNGFPAVAISSLLTQSQRTRVMEQFKGDSDKNILVATDVAARGLDIKGVDLVVNYELPDDPENYVHRIGRTGRAGAKGLAFSLVSDRDVDALSRVEGYLKHKVNVDFLEDEKIPKDFKQMQSDRSQKDFSREFEGRGGSGGGREGGRSGGGGRGAASGGRGPRPEGGGRGPRGEGRGEGGREGGRGRRDQRGAPGAAMETGPRPTPTPMAARGPSPITPRDPNAPLPVRPPKGARGERNAQAKNGNGKHAVNGRGDKNQNRKGGKSSKGGGRPIPVGAQKSVGAKVAGFFKSLFGGGK
jgi:superfamily II DNA/RNA helicase